MGNTAQQSALQPFLLNLDLGILLLLIQPLPLHHQGNLGNNGVHINPLFRLQLTLAAVKDYDAVRFIVAADRHV